MRQIDAQAGDMIYVCDKRAWLGGIRSTHLTTGPAHDQPGQVWLASASLDNANLIANKPVTVEKII